MEETKLSITGTGTHGCYIKLSKETYEFWSNVIEEHGDNLLIDYMIKFDEDGYDIQDVEEIEEFPDYAQFLTDKEGNEYHWNDTPLSSIYWNGLDCKSVIEDEEGKRKYPVSKFNKIEQQYSIPSDVKYGVQFIKNYKVYSPFTIQLEGEFQPEKLKIFTTHYPLIGKVIETIEYDGIECDLSDGVKDTTHFEVALFTNEV